MSMNAPDSLAAVSTGIQRIPLAQLRESPMNPRKAFDAAKLKELAESIRQKGILTPLLVRRRKYELASKAATEPDMTYEILAGARRFRAAKLVAEILGAGDAPCLVLEVGDTAALEIITMENLQREDLTALEEAQGFKQLLDLGKYDVGELAKRLGKSQSYVYQRIKLVDLAPDAAKALVENRITPGHAILIARLQPNDQARALREAAPTRYNPLGRSVRELGNFIKEQIQLDLTRAPWNLDDPTLLSVARAASCSACPKREKDSCLDPACYEAKLAAHLLRVEKGAGGRLLKLSAEYGGGEGLLGKIKWHEAKPGSCPDATAGLVMEGGWANGREHRRGEQLTVCVNPKCKVHWKQETAAGSSSYKRPAAELKKERKRREELAKRGRLFKALTEKRIVVTDDDTRKIADWMADRLDHDHISNKAKRLCEAMGWEPAKTNYGGKGYEGAVRKRLKAMKIEDVEQWILWLVIADEDLYFGTWETPRPGLLAACVKRAKIKLPPPVAKTPAKPKSHTSAKVKPAPAKKKRAA
ncbi:MAG TPA: ParB/RepB/Spo0J family partition protein [Bryobacteraceae bacterium]|jgi:ParB family chromosome partitioning protein|nr:ParB/RepB/Spo0J family partition protein [Bryobacteraceae bacterium]